MQVQSKHTIRAWRTADCDKTVRYLITPLTAMARQQLIIDNVKTVTVDGIDIQVNQAQFVDEAARYALLDIEGLFEKKKPFEIVKDTVAEFGMKTKVRDDCWAQIPEVLKAEIYSYTLLVTNLPEKEIESLGFTLLSPGTDWKNAPVAKRKK